MYTWVIEGTFGTGFSMFTPVPQQPGWWCLSLTFFLLFKMAQSTLVLIRTVVIYNVWIISHSFLFNVKMQSEGMTFSPVWEPKRSPGEQDAAALLNNINQWMNMCFLFIPPLKLGQPSHSALLIRLDRVWEGWWNSQERVLLPVACIDW